LINQKIRQPGAEARVQYLHILYIPDRPVWDLFLNVFFIFDNNRSTDLHTYPFHRMHWSATVARR
jgi:hypothetical protein